jgi:hypothetical protein
MRPRISYCRRIPCKARTSGRASVKQFSDQFLDALVDLVADASHSREVVFGWVVERPVLVSLPGIYGQASPQPIVITTSAARTTSSVSGLGNSSDVSMPSSAIASTTAGLISSAGELPAVRT